MENPEQGSLPAPVWTLVLCRNCGGAFESEDEWDNRHTPDDDPLADVHERCCTDCPADVKGSATEGPATP